MAAAYTEHETDTPMSSLTDLASGIMADVQQLLKQQMQLLH